MTDENTTVKVVISLPASELESLRSFVAYSGGSILKESKTRKRKLVDTEQHDSAQEEQASLDRTAERGQEYSLGRLRRDAAQNKSAVGCLYCLQQPCITTPDETKAGFLRAYGPPRLQNIGKRYRNYREFYKLLKKARLWHNPAYVERKSELGIFIDDVREVMPNCVVKDVRGRWPNPPGVPYTGHVPTHTV